MKNTVLRAIDNSSPQGKLQSNRQALSFRLMPLRSLSSISVAALSILLVDSLTIQPSQAYLPDRSTHTIEQGVVEPANLTSLCAQQRDCLPITNHDLNNQDLAPKELSQTASVLPTNAEVTSDLELAPQTLDPIAAPNSSLLTIAKTIVDDESSTETMRALAPANSKTEDRAAQELSSKEVAPLLAQTQDDRREFTSPQKTQSAREVLGTPSIQLQGVLLSQGDEFSARARVSAIYAVSPDALFGAVVDLTTGNDFSDSRVAGLSINELYFAVSPSNLPSLRFVVGQMDLTSYFDRNSFAKDGATHFFNPVFQTNPALSATGIASRPGVLVNWAITDSLEVKATTFSSSRSLGDFAFDAFAGEVALRVGDFILRGTYASDRDAG